MYSKLFEQPMRVDDESDLREIFGTERLFMRGGSVVKLGGKITLGLDVVFEGECCVMDGSSISHGCILSNVRLGTTNKVRPYSILSNVSAGSDNLFGPYCFIRDNCKVGDSCILGSHAEITRSDFGSYVKVSHRAFIGDAHVGQRTIVGAGVVFCNYDGKRHQKIQVGSDVLLGSGTLLVAPLSIGDNVVIAAGSTIVKDVSKDVKIIQKR